MITRIYSGGQDGADTGFLLAGRALGLPTGGWAPRGWRTDDGPAPWLASFGLREHESAAYPPRTALNVFENDATILFGHAWSPGCTLTQRYARAYRKPVFFVSWPYVTETEDAAVQRFRRMLDASPELKHWNGAGNREARNPGICQAAARFLWLVVRGA